MQRPCRWCSGSSGGREAPPHGRARRAARSSTNPLLAALLQAGLGVPGHGGQVLGEEAGKAMKVGHRRLGAARTEHSRGRSLFVCTRAAAAATTRSQQASSAAAAPSRRAFTDPGLPAAAPACLPGCPTHTPLLLAAGGREGAERASACGRAAPPACTRAATRCMRMEQHGAAGRQPHRAARSRWVGAAAARGCDRAQAARTRMCPHGLLCFPWHCSHSVHVHASPACGQGAPQGVGSRTAAVGQRPLPQGRHCFL